jgi:hypothetical protein
MSFLFGVQRLAKRFLVDQVEATVFVEHYERPVARVARLCASGVPPTGVLYVLSLVETGLSVPARKGL